jgi:hypothetical protein
MCYQEFELNLAIDPNTDSVAAWGLRKKEYKGIELILFRMGFDWRELEFPGAAN